MLTLSFHFGVAVMPKLEGRLEVFEDFPPTAFVPGTAPMALVHDDEVEEVGRVLSVQARAAFVFGNGLIDGEVDFPPLADLAVGDLPAGIAERREGLVLRVVDQDVAVGKVENLGAAVFARPVPQGVPELPADLEGDQGLAGAGRHREQDSPLPFQDRLHHPIDGDLLVVAKLLLGLMVAGREKLLGGLVVIELPPLTQPGPQFVGRRERVDLSVPGRSGSRTR